MNLEEEQTLVDVLMRHRVLWVPDNITAREVLRIAHSEDEPSRCAFFERGYVALYNCELSDFKTISDICAKSMKEPERKLTSREAAEKAIMDSKENKPWVPAGTPQESCVGGRPAPPAETRTVRRALRRIQ